MKAAKKSDIEKMIMLGIEADIDRGVERHTTGKKAGGWNRKLEHGRMTRGMSKKQWSASQQKLEIESKLK